MPTIRGLLNRARELVINGELAPARALCEQVLERYPKHAEAHVLLGEAAREAGQFEDARHLFLTALAFDPENGIGYWALGLIAEREGQTDVARSLLDRALEYLPGDADLWEAIYKLRGSPPRVSSPGLGRAYLRQGLFHRARRELELALTEQPSRLDVRLALAECLWRMGLIGEARRRCDEVLEASPDCLKGLLLLADCNRQQRRPAAAERLLRRAASIDPDGDLATGLFVDSDPTWITRDPIELAASPLNEEPIDERPEPINWIERLARLVEPAPPAPEPRLSDWFAETTDDLAGGLVEESLLEDESLVPWHDLLTIGLTVPSDVQERLRATLADLIPTSSEYGDGWHELTLKAKPVEGATAEIRNPREGVEASRVHPSPAESSERPANSRGTIADEPIEAHARLVRAAHRQELGDFSGALVDYQILLATAPDLIPEAVDRLRALVDARADDASARRTLAEAYAMTGQFRRAIDEFDSLDAAKVATPAPVP
ncbi:MAG: tetratricopeptide repeat protein [Chloroflexota bacterium]